MAFKHNDPCIENALPEELLFVLMARDNTAPKVICEWIKENIENQPPEKLHEALATAISMAKTWHSTRGQIERHEKLKKLAGKLRFDDIIAGSLWIYVENDELVSIFPVTRVVDKQNIYIKRHRDGADMRKSLDNFSNMTQVKDIRMLPVRFQEQIISRMHIINFPVPGEKAN